MGKTTRRWMRKTPLSVAFVRSLALFVGLVAAALAANAQTDFTRVYGPADPDVPVPQAMGVWGRIDPAATSQLAAYVKAVGTPAWKDMSATGQITYQGGGKPEQDSATLTVLNGDNYRLDVQTRAATTDADGQARLAIDPSTNNDPLP